jgi:hypothetical protein
MQSKQYDKCFQTHEEVRKLVVAWFEKNLKTMSIAEATCYYNTGHKVNNCNYYQKFKSL